MKQKFVQGFKKTISEGIVKREDLFIIGKIWINQRDDPEKDLKGTLERLQLKYIDMYIDHWPTGKNYEPKKPEDFFKIEPINDFWKKMEKLVEKGLAKSIGVSNYNVQALCNLLSFCKIKPVANEIEFHPYFCQKKLKEFCDKENIAIISYYPLAHGNGAKEYIRTHNGEMDIFKEPLVIELAKKYSKINNMEINEGMIILNWHIQLGNIPIPGTCNINRMKGNLKALEFKLEKEDIKKLSSFEKQIISINDNSLLTEIRQLLYKNITIEYLNKDWSAKIESSYLFNEINYFAYLLNTGSQTLDITCDFDTNFFFII